MDGDGRVDSVCRRQKLGHSQSRTSGRESGRECECVNVFEPRGGYRAVDRCHFETVLRALAEGRVLWAFWPPGTTSEASKLSATGDGIWIRRDDGDTGVNSDGDGEEEEMEHDRGSESGDEGSEGDDFSDEEGEVTIGGRFGALELEDGVAQSTEED